MIYFFINVLMYLVILLFLALFFSKKRNIYAFLILLFNMNMALILIATNKNFLYSIVISLFSILLYYFFLSLKKDSQDTILIQNGNINYHEVINKYSYAKLVQYLKFRNIKLDQVAYCIKNNNHLIVIKNDKITSFPVSLILDGEIISENLKLIKKDLLWLNKELLLKKISIKDINYAYYRNNQIFFITN